MSPVQVQNKNKNMGDKLMSQKRSGKSFLVTPEAFENESYETHFYNKF